MKKDWVYKKLGEVANVIHGKNQKEVLSTNGKYPIYGSGGTIMGYATEYLCEAGTTILGRKGTINNPQFINHKFWNVDTAFGISARKDIDSKFLYFFIKKQDWSKMNTGTTLPSLTQAIVKNVIIPLPPLSEQKEIVEYLDSSFAKIDKLKENAAKNLEEAKALFQSALKDALEPKEGWEEKTIQNVCEILNGFAFPSASFMNKGCLKVIKITNVGVGEFIEDNSRLSIEHQDNSAKVNENDIVIALTRTIIADGLKKARVPFSYDGALLNQRVAALTPKKNVVENSFVYYYLGTAQVSKYVLSKVNTLMQPNLSIGDLKKMPIPLPSLQEQQSIVSLLDSLNEKVNTLQQNYSRICNECDALKQAILRQVFE